MTTSCLVTGGFGFLGSHLVRMLVQRGASRVHVVDDLSTSALGVEAFAREIESIRPGVLTYDVASIESFSRRGPRGSAPGPFGEIYHLASIVGPVGVLGHAGRIAGRIVEDSCRMMDLARRCGARMCDVSTGEVYGVGRGGPCAESDPRTIPAEVTVRLEYAVAKLACEIALVNATRAGDLRAVIVRPFNIAGPGQSARGGFVLPRFVDQALSGRPLTVYGDGSAVRALTHVSDVADGLIRALRSGRPGGDYNLGNAANRTTILDLAHWVLRVTCSASQIELVDPRRLHGERFAEAWDKFPDGDLAQRELGWAPSRSLDAIVRETVDHAREARMER